MKKILLSVLMCTGLGWAQPVHDQLRAMKDQAVSDLNAGNFEAVLKLADENIDFTAMDAHPNHGKAEVKAYFDRMLQGPDAVVKSFHTTVEVDRLTTLYGSDFGVATGSSVSDYKLKDGKDFQIQNRWTATVVRRNGNWVLASFHTSANVFDNPLLGLSQKFSTLIAAAVGFLGLILGWFLGRKSRK